MWYLMRNERLPFARPITSVKPFTLPQLFFFLPPKKSTDQSGCAAPRSALSTRRPPRRPRAPQLAKPFLSFLFRDPPPFPPNPRVISRDPVTAFSHICLFPKLLVGKPEMKGREVRRRTCILTSKRIFIGKKILTKSWSTICLRKTRRSHRIVQDTWEKHSKVSHD